MATRTFNGTTNTTFSTASNWDGGVSVPSAADNIIIASNCVLTANDATVYGTLTVNNGISFNIQTFDFNCGITVINGTYQIGISSSNGFTCSGFTANIGSSLDFQNTSKINNGGNYSCPNAQVFLNSNRGIYTQTGSGNYSEPFNGNYFYSWTQNSGVTTTLTTVSYITSYLTTYCTINGTVTGPYTLNIGVAATGIMTIGSSADISTSLLSFYTLNGATYINNKTSAFTTSVVNCAYSGVDMLTIPAWDFSNSYVTIQGSSVALRSRYISYGTLSCKNLTITSILGNIVYLNCSNNPSFIISGNITFTTTDDVIYTKGSGTITLIGTTGTQTIDFNGKSVESLVVAASGSTKQLVSTKNVSTPSLAVSGGTFDFNTSSCNVSGAVSISSTGILKGGISTPTTYSNVPYTRSGTTAIVTLNNHGFLYGERPTITIRSDSSTFNLATYLAYNHTTNTFCLRCIDAGALSGTITFTIPLSNSGLVCNGLTFSTGVASADFAVNTRIDNYGNLTIGNAAVWKTSITGIYCQRGNGTLTTSNASGFLPYTTIIYPSVTIIPAASLIIGNNSSNMIFSLYGIISSSVLFTLPGCGGIYFDTNSDITGTGQCTIYNEQDYPLSDFKRTTDLSFTGILIWSGNSGSFRKPIALGTNGEIKFGQGITNSATMKLQLSTGFGNIMRCTKFTNGVGSTNSGLILNNTNNIEIQCSGQIDLGMTQSIPYESKWNKTDSNIRIGSNNLSVRSTNVPLSLINSSNSTTIPNDIYSLSSVRTSSTLTWTKVDANDTFITVTENSTPLLVNDSFQVLTSSTASVFVNDVPTVISKTTNNFSIPITIDCIWERVGTTLYITVPKPHGLTAANTMYISVSSDISSIPIGIYNVDAVSGTQILITCNNSGALSGTLTYNARHTTGTISYGYLNVTASDSIGSGTNGTCHLNGITYWIGGTGKIKLIGSNQNLYTSGNYYTLYWTRTGTTATLFYKNNTINQLVSPHGLINGQYIYFDGLVNSSAFPKGMYPITVIDNYKFSVQCIDTGLQPGVVTSCTRSVNTMSIPSNNHGLINGANIYLTYITDQQINALNIVKSITYQNNNLFTISVSNAGLSSGITVEWCSVITVFIPVNYPKSTLNTYFKYDKIDVNGSTGDLPILSDFSTVSFGTSTANNIIGAKPNTQQTIYVNTDSTGINSLYTGSTIKNISMGSANRINAKTSTNLGNNKGIVFKDTIK